MIGDYLSNPTFYPSTPIVHHLLERFLHLGLREGLAFVN